MRRQALRCAMIVLAALLAACGQGTAAPSPSASTSGAFSAAAAPSPAASTPASAAAAPASPAAAASKAATTAPAGEAEFQNPVIRADFADPFILSDDGTYYAYATNAVGKNVQAARSTDLISWESLPDAMPALPSWAQLGGSFIWAPEVIKVGEQYLLYFTARDKAADKQCIGVAVAAAPQGRFKDSGDKPLVCQVDQGGTIDASPFRDGDKLYLYFKNDGNCCAQPTYLYVQELAPDGLSLVGEPTQLVRNDQAWEGRVVEAPTMVRHADAYLLFFSANDYAGPPYAVGYATCASPVGPCTDAPENPILKSKMDRPPLVVGPGHQTVFDIGDQTWIAYHAWEVGTNGLRGSRRFMYLDRIDWMDGKPVVAGPTLVPQPRP